MRSWDHSKLSDVCAAESIALDIGTVFLSSQDVY